MSNLTRFFTLSFSFLFLIILLFFLFCPAKFSTNAKCSIIHILLCHMHDTRLHHRVGSSNYGPSPLSSRHGSQESLRHLNTMGSMSMLQTPTSSVRDSVSAAQKKKSIKSSLGRFFSKKEKVCWNLSKIIQNVRILNQFNLFIAGKGRQRFHARRFG